MHSVTLSNFDELIKRLVTYQSNERHPELWFRGQQDADWKLVPGAFREGRADQYNEGEVLRRFKLRAPACIKNPPEPRDYARWLPLMQHHGVPTRLLDWTLSPLVALFFAVYRHSGKSDAAIFGFNPWAWSRLHYKNPNLIPIESIEKDDSRFSLIQGAFDSVKGVEAPLPVYSSSAHFRSVKQQSVYTIHNSERPLEEFPYSDCITKFTIPNERIHEFQLVLKALQINEFAIYADPDALGRWVSSLEPND